MVILGCLVTASFAFAQESVPASESLCPSTWDEGEVERYLARNRVYGAERPGCDGHEMMIGGTSGAFAIHAGFEALERGGTAMDAALTTALAQTTLVAGSWVSFAGIANIVYYDAASGEVWTLNAGFNTVADEDDPLSIPKQGTPSGRTAFVPGFMSGVECAHERFGRLPFARLFDPAIFLAERGFPVDEILASLFVSRQRELSRKPETRALFTNEDGEWLGVGDILRQPALAETLRNVARDGADFMVYGDWAEQFVDAVRDDGGKLTMEDLEAYEVAWERPSSSGYRGHDVCTLPPPEMGATMLLEGLNLAEAMGAGDEPDAKDAEWLYRFIQASRLSYLISWSDGYAPHADVLREGQLTPSTRMTKEHAEECLELLEAEAWNKSWEVRAAQRFGASPEGKRGTHSDGIVAVDAMGNVCAMVHSINTATWGTTGLFVGGVSIPDSASFQQEMIARIGPGRRLPNVTNPCLVLRDGKPVLAASVIGSALHECMLQNVVNILDFGMTPQESVNAPKFWGPSFMPGTSVEIVGLQAQNVDPRLGDELLDALMARGQPVVRHPNPQSHFVGIRLGEAGALSGGGTLQFNGGFEGR